MTLATMVPADDWEPSAAERAAIETFERDATGLSITVWGGDWCGDCRAELPRFAAALAAAGIDPEGITQLPVETQAGGSKTGPLVDRYEVEVIPTIVIERDGAECARFAESGRRPAIVELADQLIASTPTE